MGFAGLRPLCSTTAPRFVVGSEDGQTRFLDEFAADGWARHAIATGRRDELLPVSSCGVLKQCGTVVRAGAVRPLGKEHEQERGCGEGNGTQNADWELGRVPRSLGFVVSGRSSARPCGAY